MLRILTSKFQIVWWFFDVQPNIISHSTRNWICGALRDLVPFVKFKKCGKHPWRSVNFSRVAGFKPATLPKLTLLHGFFSRFLNCKNGTKSRNAPQMVIFKRLHIIRVKKYLESFLYKLIWFSVEKAFGVPGTKYF